MDTDRRDVAGGISVNYYLAVVIRTAKPFLQALVSQAMLHT